MNPAWLIAPAAGAGVVAHGLFAPGSGVFGRVVSRLAPGAGGVALTFDDGPLPGATESVLDILRGAGASASFFVIGRHAERHPDLLRRIHGEGHLLGNHTYDHSRLGLFRGWAYWREQVERTNTIIAGVTGAPARYFRPPMGFKSPPVFAAARGAGLRVVTWTRRTLDGVVADPARIAARGAAARAGDILLLHDGKDQASRRDPGVTVAALPRILAGLHERGVPVVRLDAAVAHGQGGP